MLEDTYVGNAGMRRAAGLRRAAGGLVSSGIPPSLPPFPPLFPIRISRPTRQTRAIAHDGRSIEGAIILGRLSPNQTTHARLLLSLD